VAEQSICNFILRNEGHCYFWTFSEPGRSAGEVLWTKDEAEAHFKPFRDLCDRQGVELLVVWERQKRGAWHPHCLVNKRFDVNWLRPWMVSRGWGPQMRVELLARHKKFDHGWHDIGGDTQRVFRYLTKYLTKSRTGPEDVKKKIFSCTGAGVKAGSTSFSWVQTEKPGRWLYWHGRELFRELYGRLPKWRDAMAVIRVGVEATGWADVDFLWEFQFQRSG
jgi:hypothetical protein